MALYHPHNLFAGVNPHLMSRHQTPNTHLYRSFHNDHITDIKRLLQAQLPRGYEADSEDLLTIVQQSTGYAPFFQPRYPDISIRTSPSSLPTTIMGEAIAAEPTLRIPIVASTEDEPLSIAISSEGRVVAVIEMLSPSNKQGRGAQDYQVKRLELLQVGIVLVEIDYLHETKSPIEGLPSYPRDQKSQPYYIAVSDPRNEIAVYSFGINQPIPTLKIPLVGQDSVIFDFDRAYQHTFEQGFYRKVDYHELPSRMESYHPDDQALIRAHVATIWATYSAVESASEDDLGAER
jgi:hypothetical protein